MPRSSTPSPEPRSARSAATLPVLALLALGAVVAALAIAEVALRWRHFHYRPFPEVQFGWPEPQTIADEFLTDPDLLWVTKGYRQRLRDARRAHPAIVFLGDSCVEFSRYPEMTLTRLAAVDASIATGVKLSVPGWTTEQGRTQLGRDVLSIHPRLVTVEFGWNDHWDALGPPDADTHPGAITQWAGAHLRVFQAYVKAREGLEVRRHPDRPRRVSLERYRENLRVMIAETSRAGARVVLITAPSDHERGREPRYLEARHLKQLSTLVPLHEAYVQATRDVAAETHATLCDAAATIAADPRRRAYFRHDGIHFVDAGDRLMSQLVAACIERAVHP
ncbi:MAG: hypothetical protein DMF85_05240 [Acidobacteria bacterium]|nr:MAG: hypothetical protein DMF85_05240 [Acidobacteriota bacterium]